MLKSVRFYLTISSFILLALAVSNTIHAAGPKVEIETLVEGTGEEAVDFSKVTVHYTGWLANGKKFDSSLDRRQPFDFYLGAGQVIPGWDIGVKGMKIGGKRRLTIPPHLGYGPRGAGDAIPPNSTLVFEVELLAVIPPKYKNIDNAQLKDMQGRNVTVVDIRRQDEWNRTGVVEGSHKLTAFDKRGNFIRSFVAELAAIADPEKEVIFICQHGNRSAVIANFLTQQRGYENVYNVTQGISHWIKDGQPVVK